MDGYFIGSGAILEAGERSQIVGATLHAQMEADVTPRVVLIDFEGGSLPDVRRLLAVVAGYSVAVFDGVVASRLLAAGACGFDDVVRILAESTGAADVDLYARWEPPATIVASLASAGIKLRCHPIESVSRAALIAQHRYQSWEGGLRAA